MIVIDADGCPVVNLTLDIAQRFGVKCCVVADTSHSFDFGDNLIYDQEKMLADIEFYGLYDYAEWEEYCDISVFE